MTDHAISNWSYAGTGLGDDRDGWRCDCGVFGIGSQGMEAHVDAVIAIRKANEALA